MYGCICAGDRDRDSRKAFEEATAVVQVKGVIWGRYVGMTVSGLILEISRREKLVDGKPSVKKREDSRATLKFPAWVTKRIDKPHIEMRKITGEMCWEK